MQAVNNPKNMILDTINPSTMAQSGYLGPATILDVDGKRVRLECPDEFPWAQVALFHAYEPVVGDTVLAISRGGDWYVIGLLQGTGTTTFTAPGNIEFHAPNGKIDFLAGEQISIKSEQVEILANNLELTATKVFQRFCDVTQWIKNALHQRIGRLSTAVEEDYHLTAERITEQAEGDVKVQGKMIHLN